MVPIVNIEDLRQLARGYLPKAVFDFVDGGRQLDSAVSAVSALPSIVDAVGDRAEVILDGGVRRGIDVVKALCLGARACMVSRPFLYGLAAKRAWRKSSRFSGMRPTLPCCFLANPLFRV